MKPPRRLPPISSLLIGCWAQFCLGTRVYCATWMAFFIFEPDQGEHEAQLADALSSIQDAGVTLNTDKCLFSQTCISFLGLIIDQNGVSADPNKTAVVLQMNIPTNTTELHRLIGMVNKLGKFSLNLAEIFQLTRTLQLQNVYCCLLPKTWAWEEKDIRKEDHWDRAWLFHPNRFVNKWWMGPVGYCCFQEACWPFINQALSAIQYSPGIYAVQDCILADSIHNHVPPRSQIFIPQSRPQHNWWAGLSSGPHRGRGPAVRLALLDWPLATICHMNIMLSCKCKKLFMYWYMCNYT